MANLAISNAKDLVNSESEFYCPPMKCIDMYFGEIGYEIDIAKGLVDNRNNKEKKDSLLSRAVSLHLCSENLTCEEAHSEIMGLNQ